MSFRYGADFKRFRLVQVASDFCFGFPKLLRKLSFETISLLYLTFIKLLEKFIKNLAAISAYEVLQLSLGIISVLQPKVFQIYPLSNSYLLSRYKLQASIFSACYLRICDRFRRISRGVNSRNCVNYCPVKFYRVSPKIKTQNNSISFEQKYNRYQFWQKNYVLLFPNSTEKDFFAVS